MRSRGTFLVTIISDLIRKGEGGGGGGGAWDQCSVMDSALKLCFFR